MDMVDALDRTFASTRTVVAEVRPEHLKRPTPCAEWDVQALLDHMNGSIESFGYVAARQAPPPDAPTVPESALERYDAATARTLDAWRAPGALDGDVSLAGGAFVLPAAVAICINHNDCLIHGWDVARAIGVEAELDPELAEIALESSHTILTAELRPVVGFDPEISVSPDASPTARLVAYTGRKP